MNIPASSSGHFRQRTPPFSFEIVALNSTNRFWALATNNKENL